MIKKYLAISFFFFAHLAYSQSLDPKVSGVAGCAGAVNAGHVFNYETENLNKNQLKDAYHITSLALELAIASKGRNHYINNIDDYNSLVEAGFDDTYTELSENTFDWDSQVGLDYCQVKLFEYVAKPPESAFWAGDFEFFREISRDQADAAVNFIVEYLENF